MSGNAPLYLQLARFRYCKLGKAKTFVGKVPSSCLFWSSVSVLHMKTTGRITYKTTVAVGSGSTS